MVDIAALCLAILQSCGRPFRKAGRWLKAFATLGALQERVEKLGTAMDQAGEDDLRYHAGIPWRRIPPDGEHRQAFCPACGGKDEWVPLALQKADRLIRCFCPACRRYVVEISPDDVAVADGPPLEAIGEERRPPEIPPSATYGPG